MFQPSECRRRAVRVLWLAAVLAVVPSLPLAGRVFIAEIHYHPAGPPQDAERLEFVELYNDEPLPFDISEYSLAGGIAYSFPRGTTIESGAALAVARDPDFLAAAAGIALPLGPFEGRLADDGDEVLLIDTGGSTVTLVRFNDRGSWPAAADGAGPSLVLRDPLLDPAVSASWGWSPRRGGTPGAVSFETVIPEVVINEVDRTPGAGRVELFRPGATGLDLSGYRLLADAGGGRGAVLPPGAAIAAGGYLVVPEAALGLALDPADQPLYLLAPDGERVVDARRLGAKPEAGSDGRYPDASAHWSRLSPATPLAANRRAPAPPVVLSEIHYHPYSEDDADEFLELANRGPGAVDLGGWRLNGVGFVFPPGAAIGPGQFLVLARDPGRIEAAHGISGVLGPYPGVLADGGELLELLDASGGLVDEVRYRDDGSWPPWADGDGPSLELIDLAAENDAGSSWRESDHAAASSWQSYEYTARQTSGDSELHLYLLGAGESLVDDIEVVRAGEEQNLIPDGDFDGANPLAAWRIDGTHIDSRIEPGAGPDGSNALRIVASAKGDSGANRIERQTSPNLVPGAEYTVRFKARWLGGVDLIMTRSWNHGLARATRLVVPPRGGTPGRANSRAAPLGPAITDVEQSPPLPAPGEAVVVRARVRDERGVASVALRWRLDGEAEFVEAAMADGGVAPDAVAGDGVWAGRIEAAGASGAVAEFYLRALGAAGEERTHPAVAPAATLLYQYRDEIPASAVPAYRLILRRADHDTLRRRSPFSNHLLPASLAVRDARIVHQAGLRYRGSPYLRRASVSGNEKGYRLDLSDENAFLGGVHITLDEQAVEPTYQVDRFVRHLLQKTGGIAYGERRHVHVIVRGVSAGTYEHVLTVDGRYLERAFGADNAEGGMYKLDAHYEIDDGGEFPFPGFTSWRFTEDKETLRFTYVKRNHEKQDDFTDLMELLRLMDVRTTPDEEFDARAGALIDLDAWARGIAVYRTVEDWDAIGGWTGKNVYIYRHPDGRWRFIPWDHDVAMGAASLQSDQNPRAYLYTPYFPEIRRLLQRPALDRKFNAEILRLLAEDYDRAAADPTFDRTWDLLRTASGAAAPSGIKLFLSARRTHLLGQVRDPPAFTIETNGGKPFTTAQSPVLLSGKAPFAVEVIAVGGAPVAVHWRDRESWEIEAPLAAGLNRLRLTALDRRFQAVAAAAIDVTLAASGGAFRRGDSRRDGRLDLADALQALDVLFFGGTLACLDAADADDSGTLDLTDATYLLDYLFLGGPEPPAPFVEEGADPTEDGLACP